MEKSKGKDIGKGGRNRYDSYCYYVDLKFDHWWRYQ